MLIFHEGLPGSGKSYEAAVNRIIPELKKGRQVFAYIEGLNYEKFSNITDIPTEKLQGEVTKIPISAAEKKKHRYIKTIGNQLYSIEYIGLLHQLESDQVKNVHNHVADDSLVIIDELQDYFPVGTRKLDEGITKFVTQHRHRGIDIVAMGQDHRDCHNLWKRRIDQLIHFTKRDAIGRPNDYTWVTYKQQQGRLKKLRAGKGTYDKKYFGLYSSHVPGAENTETYNDDRSNIFKSAGFRIYLPAFAGVLVFAIYFLTTIFTGERQIVKTPPPKKINTEQAEPQTVPIHSVKHQNQPSEQPEKPPQYVDYAYENYVINLAEQYKPRLAAIIENKSKITAYIEFLDKSFHVHERLELQQLKALGWEYMRTEYGIRLERDKTSLVITAWPIDSVGKVSNYHRGQLNNEPY